MWNVPLNLKQFEKGTLLIALTLKATCDANNIEYVQMSKVIACQNMKCNGHTTLCQILNDILWPTPHECYVRWSNFAECLYKRLKGKKKTSDHYELLP